MKKEVVEVTFDVHLEYEEDAGRQDLIDELTDFMFGIVLRSGRGNLKIGNTIKVKNGEIE